MFDYIPDFLPSTLVKEQLDETSFLSTTFDKKVNKEQLWFGPDYFNKQWTTIRKQWVPQEYPIWLSTLQDRVQEKYNEMGLSDVNINSCLVNKYRTGIDHIKPHRDSNYSFGKEPPKEIKHLMDTFADHLSHLKMKKKHSRKQHQYGNTECGIYSMNFLINCIKGKSLSQINKKRIPDKKMNQMRAYLYRNIDN